jgi:signal transduction histidine kinase
MRRAAPRPHPAALLRIAPAWAVEATIVAVALADALLTLISASPLTTGLALVAAAGLLVRRRLPVVSLLLVLPALHVGCAVIAMVIALFSVAERVRRSWLIGVCAGLVFAMQLVVAAPFESPRDLFTAGVSAALFAGGPVALGLLARTGAELRERYEELRSAQEAQREMAARETLARERTVLAREMHDVVSHNVSLIAVQAGALQVSAADAGVRGSARTIRGLSVLTLEELRTMVALLRASGGTTREVHPQPTVSDIPGLVAASGIDAEVSIDLHDGLPSGVQRAVYRTVQECLTNARKHAPGAAVRIDAHQSDEAVHLAVRTGSATEPRQPLPGSGLGLLGLEERAHLLGGTFSAGPAGDGGWEARLAVPVA